MRRGGSLAVGAGEGNRTLVSCLGSNSSTIELRPHSERFSTAFSVFNGHHQGGQRPKRLSTFLRLLPTFFTVFFTAAADLPVFFVS
jgi:hypothetical protein